MIEFHDTVMGRRFYEGTMPRIADALEHLVTSAASLIRQNEQVVAAAERPKYPRLEVAHAIQHVRSVLPHLEFVSRKAIFDELAILLQEYCPKCGHVRRGTPQETGCVCGVPKA